MTEGGIERARRRGGGVETEIGGDLVGFNWLNEGGIERAHRRGSR